jgi:hypothetical protein
VIIASIGTYASPLESISCASMERTPCAGVTVRVRVWTRTLSRANVPRSRRGLLKEKIILNKMSMLAQPHKNQRAKRIHLSESGCAVRPRSVSHLINVKGVMRRVPHRS